MKFQVERFKVRGGDHPLKLLGDSYNNVTDLDNIFTLSTPYFKQILKTKRKKKK